MNKKIVLLIILTITLCLQIITLGCAKDVEIIKDNLKTDILTIPAGADIFQIIKGQNYKDIEIIDEVLGKRIIETANKQDMSVEMTVSKDSLEIHSCKISAFNATFEINVTENDTILCRVNVEKPILKGGSIFQVLTDLGMKAKNVGYYAWKLGEYIDATSIDVGDIITVDYYIDSLKVKQFEKFSYKSDKISIHEFFILGPRELQYHKIELPFELKRRFLTGEITEENNTLDAAMANLDIIPYIRQQVNNSMESQIAFSTDARVGDKFEVYIEEKYVNGEQPPRGKVLYAKYEGKNTGLKTAYRFSDQQDASAFTGMYTYKGKRLVSNAVRTPLDRMHISSSFGYRIHPLLGTRKMHKGIDLRGSSGTKVYAVTSGTVIKAKNNSNGYGKEVQIKHDNGMISQYAHLSKISTRYGRRVRKGQIIGAVGSTGRSTGPHLHFGVKKSGRWVNPKSNLKMVGANQLKNDRLKSFKAQLKSYQDEMEVLQIQVTKIDSVVVDQEGV